jgi:hypothetical protein
MPGGTTQESAYMGAAIAVNTRYQISLYVVMDNGTAPVVGTNSVTGDFVLLIDGSAAVTDIRILHIGGNVYRIQAGFTTGATLGNGNFGLLRYAGQGRGISSRFIGYQVETGGHASSYIDTAGATVTRPNENLWYTGAPTTFAGFSMYARFREKGSAHPGAANISAGVLTYSNVNPRGILYWDSSFQKYLFYGHNGSGSSYSLGPASPPYGSMVELRGFWIGGQITLAQTVQGVNGGVEEVAPSVALPHPANFGSAFMMLNAFDSNSIIGRADYTHFHVEEGAVARDTFRDMLRVIP